MEAMKQPTPLWQVISICVVVLIASMTGIVTQSNRVASLQRDLENVKSQLYNTQISADKKFDRIDNKIDLIQNDTRQILVNLERKEDKK